jgi:hypothetical protein
LAFTYDITTDRGKTRGIIPDRVAADYFFEDDEIDAFLTMEGSIKCAAALALETLASNEAYVQKVIKLLDITTSGDRVSDALLKRADRLRAQAALEGETFEPISMVVDQFSFYEHMRNEALRGG